MQKFLVIGYGQIGRQITADLAQAGHQPLVLQRSPQPATTSTIRFVAGDAADEGLLARHAAGCSAIFACLHAPYRADAWRAQLPPRELAIMNVAAQRGIPVVFPESVYAFGRQAHDLAEDAPTNPMSPLGEVRAELLEQRAAHPATTLSIVASDLVGPTATTKGSIPTATVISAAHKGATCWVLGSVSQPHSMTYIPDLSRAMIASALQADLLTPRGNAVFNAPSGKPLTMGQLAALVNPDATLRLRTVPSAAFRAIGLISPTTRAVREQLYLWQNPTILRAGKLETMVGLHATAWAQRSLLPQEVSTQSR